MRNALLAVAIFALVLVLVGISYLFTVALTWFAMKLAHMLWQFTWNPSVWVLGGFVWIVLFALRIIFTGGNKK